LHRLIFLIDEDMSDFPHGMPVSSTSNRKQVSSSKAFNIKYPENKKEKLHDVFFKESKKDAIILEPDSNNKPNLNPKRDFGPPTLQKTPGYENYHNSGDDDCENISEEDWQLESLHINIQTHLNHSELPAK